MYIRLDSGKHYTDLIFEKLKFPNRRLYSDWGYGIGNAVSEVVGNQLTVVGSKLGGWESV